MFFEQRQPAKRQGTNMQIFEEKATKFDFEHDRMIAPALDYQHNGCY